MHRSRLLLSSLFLAITLGCPAGDPAGDPAKDGDPSKDTGTTDICDFPVDWHPDSDSDGFGDADTEAQPGCDAPEPGWVSNGDDCDDTLAGVNPDALEICDGIDNNCDQVTDDPADLGTFDSVSAGSQHNCGVTSSGSVECWGKDAYGESTPPSGTFESVSSADYITCGVKSDGSVECWGWDTYGQSTPPSGTFNSVSVGEVHGCGVTSSGSVECWGSDTYGRATPP